MNISTSLYLSSVPQEVCLNVLHSHNTTKGCIIFKPINQPITSSILLDIKSISPIFSIGILPGCISRRGKKQQPFSLTQLELWSGLLSFQNNLLQWPFHLALLKFHYICCQRISIQIRQYPHYTQQRVNYYANSTEKRHNKTVTK